MPDLVGVPHVGFVLGVPCEVSLGVVVGGLPTLITPTASAPVPARQITPADPVPMCRVWGGELTASLGRDGRFDGLRRGLDLIAHSPSLRRHERAHNDGSEDA